VSWSQGNAVRRQINNSNCLSNQNFHICMKTFVIAFCGCLSEGINCSLTKQQRQWEQKDPLLTIQLSF